MVNNKAASPAIRLTESAIMVALGTVLSIVPSATMIALGTVLSIVKLIDLPYGGSVTAAHMLPVILIAYRYGTGWGVFTGAVYGLLQMFLGTGNWFGYSLITAFAVIMLDYVVAYAAAGLGGAFRRSMPSQSASLALGAGLACAAQYLCHVLSGATVWAAYAPEGMNVWAYSFVYNATYMLPETIVTVVAAAYIGSVLDFRSPSITRLQKETRTDVQILLTGFAKFLVAIAAVFDVYAIFSRLQDENTGVFSGADVANAPWGAMALVTVAAIAAAYICLKASKKQDLAVLSRGLWLLSVPAAVLVFCRYLMNLLTKAASKADPALMDPSSSIGAFFGAFPALGVKYGLPLLAVTLAAIGFIVLAVRRAAKAGKKAE